MCARVDCVLVMLIVICCKVDLKGLMNIHDVVEHHKLGIICWLDGETIEEKLADEMARKFIIEILFGK
jgi:hypothetical protein